MAGYPFRRRRATLAEILLGCASLALLAALVVPVLAQTRGWSQPLPRGAGWVLLTSATSSVERQFGARLLRDRHASGKDDLRVVPVEGLSAPAARQLRIA